MARNRKSGVSFNGKIADKEHFALVKYAQETGLTKTAVVEKAIRYFIEHHLRDGMTFDSYIAQENPHTDYNFFVGEADDVIK